MTDQSRCREQPQSHPHGYEHSTSLDGIDLSFSVVCGPCPSLSLKRSISLGALLLGYSLPATTCRCCLSRPTSTNAARTISRFSSLRSSPHLRTHQATPLDSTTSPSPCDAQCWLGPSEGPRLTFVRPFVLLSLYLVLRPRI